MLGSILEGSWVGLMPLRNWWSRPTLITAAGRSNLMATTLPPMMIEGTMLSGKIVEVAAHADGENRVA